jgi:alkylresorcinol/alkylpyrone synthase
MHVASPPVRLCGLGTAVPPHELPQDIVQAAAQRLLAPRFPDFERLSKSFVSSGVRMRYSVVPLSWFEQPRNWQQRNEAYLEGATQLFLAAARAALDASNLSPAEIDTVVTVSSTGIATPTLEARTMRQLGLRPDVRRVPVFGLGCAGGVSGLSIAVRLAAAMPGSKVLMVCVEACTLSFRMDRLRKADIIATILFGDGAAAACLSTEGPARAQFGTGVEHTWPDTLDIMGWTADPSGLGVVFDRSIPDFVRSSLSTVMEASLPLAGMTVADLARPVCHPGGAKVVEAIEWAMGLPDGTLDHERDVLAEFGNMSAPTVMFVLERVLASAATGDMMLVALGPGFTAALLPIRLNQC